MKVSAVWSLDVIGPPRLVGPAGPRRIDRRTAVLLTYLAIEGPQPRARLAGLLWPETREATARANLRQLVHRLREATGAELLAAANPLALTGALAVDVCTLHELARAGDHPRVARYEGELLDGIELDDAAEVADWLGLARAALVRVRRDAALADSARLEQAGSWAEAVGAAQRAVDLDATSEGAHRQLMRTLYLSGDRAAASGAYARCRVVLRDRLGVEPSAATTQLADAIARGRRGVEAVARPTRHIPITVLRPPRLAGRAREWAAMEAAWAAGQSIMIGGAPGVGKSRLMSEFLATHAPSSSIVCAGRPGDHRVPYGTHARTYREVIQAIGRDALPAWVARELARLIPELGDAPGVLVSGEDRLRFWSAKIEVHRIAIRQGFDAFALDDLQFVDHASAEAGAYVLDQVRSDPSMPLRVIHGYRTGELPPVTMEVIRRAASAGALLHLELEPLSADAVTALLASLAIPGLEALEADIYRYAGGSPMFILETVKHLLETDQVTQGKPERVGMSGRAGAVLASRLERLSAPALELARLLAVLGTDFSLAQAGAVLEVSALELVPRWEELVAAQIVRGDAFAHDLLGEAVVAGMPAPVQRLLHARVATTLARHEGDAARIAAHWLDAGEPARAASSRRTAIAHARQSLLPHEAQRYFEVEAASGSE